MNAQREQPTRRVKVLQWVFIAIWTVCMPALSYRYAATRPKAPNPETGNIYEFNMHGSKRYLTFRDYLWLYGTIAIGWGGGFAVIVYLRGREDAAMSKRLTRP
jgi:hypothetical protein